MQPHPAFIPILSFIITQATLVITNKSEMWKNKKKAYKIPPSGKGYEQTFLQRLYKWTSTWKDCSTSLVIQEMKFKATMRHYFTPISMDITKNTKINKCWDFPGGPVVKTPCFHCRGHGFDPWLGKIPMPHGVTGKKKKKEERKKLQVYKCWWGCGEMETSYIAGGNVKWCNCCIKSLTVISKLKYRITIKKSESVSCSVVSDSLWSHGL